ncbi:hypothetical protein LTR94_026451, partial [Friedmanniomyces endolithicus]
GATTPPSILQAADITALPRQQVLLSVHGQEHSFEGPLLSGVLAFVVAPSGRDLRGPALSRAVLVQAADGYAVAFGLAELDPATRSNRIILADTMDGKPLPDEDGPFRLVAEGDLRAARSARQVTQIRLVDLANVDGRSD